MINFYIRAPDCDQNCFICMCMHSAWWACAGTLQYSRCYQWKSLSGAMEMKWQCYGSVGVQLLALSTRVPPVCRCTTVWESLKQTGNALVCICIVVWFKKKKKKFKNCHKTIYIHLRTTPCACAASKAGSINEYMVFHWLKQDLSPTITCSCIGPATTINAACSIFKL